MKYESTNPVHGKNTLKWNINGELSSIDMTRIINALSVSELRERELSCDREQKNKSSYNLEMWW